jgi:hypothetical protein
VTSRPARFRKSFSKAPAFCPCAEGGRFVFVPTRPLDLKQQMMITTMTKRNTELMQDPRFVAEPALALPRLLTDHFIQGHQPRGMALDFQDNFILGPIVSPPHRRLIPPAWS